MQPPGLKNSKQDRPSTPQYAAIKYDDPRGFSQKVCVWGPYDSEEEAQDRLIQKIQDDIEWDDFVRDMGWESSDDMPAPSEMLDYWNEFILGCAFVRVVEMRT